MSHFKLIFCFLAVTSLTNCAFYVEDKKTQEGYYYCDERACWDCDATTCYEVALAREGDACLSDFECVKGLYCNGVDRCERTDTCDSDSDCLAGEICQFQRNTCAPAVDCVEHKDCLSGFCDGGLCSPAEMCGPDADCDADEICDFRNLCVPNNEDLFCQVAISNRCHATAPTCPAGQTAAIVNGCYTGDCIDNDECTDDNPCASNTREECAEDQNSGRCAMIFRGVNCTDPNGAACDTPGTNCDCESFEYHECEAVAPPPAE